MGRLPTPDRDAERTHEQSLSRRRPPDSLGCTEVAAKQAANALLSGIIDELQREGGFTLPSFGTFTAREIKAQPRLNPATGAPVAGRAGRTVRFKASPRLKTMV